MINVLINGCNGKMGQEVIKRLDNYPEFSLLGGFDKENSGKFTFPVYTSFEQIKNLPNIIIDFSIPDATLNVLTFAKQNKIPIVIATTGFSAKQEAIIEEYANYIPIFKSANMSFDINLMCKILSNIAPALNNCDIEITETHHNKKIDAPSGTALLLANSINNSLSNKYTYNFGRFSNQEKRSKNEIGFSSIRGGNIVGEHTVQFFGDNETFEITHKTYSRSIFADGAIKAAKFLITKPNGFYTMNDLEQKRHD